jgi:hypothetical protein
MRITLAGTVLFSGWLAGCGLLHINGYDNEALRPDQNPRKIGQATPVDVRSAADLASLKVPWALDPACRNGFDPARHPVTGAPVTVCPATDGKFVGLSISGGGSRAAVFSAAVLFELQKHGVLQQVDVISSVSGGSYTAALYALSCDPPGGGGGGPPCPATVEGPERTRWLPEIVFPLLEKDFEARWVGNWFWPNNILKYWLTDYSRSQIMAETLDANLFDNSFLGGEPFRFHDLNPQRPHLIINATDNTDTIQYTGSTEALSPFLKGWPPRECREAHFFAFTQEHFRDLGSHLDQYPVSRAVVASSAFPGVFNYITLRDYSRRGKRFTHVFDAGPYDNLGVSALRCAATQVPRHVPRFAVVIDAFVKAPGKSSRISATRGGVGYLVDLNALESTDVMLARLHRKLIDATREWATVVYVIGFDNLLESTRPAAKETYDAVNKIGTRLSLEEWHLACLRRAAVLATEVAVREMQKPPPTFGAAALADRDTGYRVDPAILPDCKEPPPALDDPEIALHADG